MPRHNPGRFQKGYDPRRVAGYFRKGFDPRRHILTAAERWRAGLRSIRFMLADTRNILRGEVMEGQPERTPPTGYWPADDMPF